MSVADRDEKILRKIRKYCREIEDFIAGVEYAEFDSGLQINRACIFTLEQIGENAKGLSENFKNTYNNIPLQEMMGLRNRIVHDYDGIYLDIVWETITEDIPKLLEALDKIVEECK